MSAAGVAKVKEHALASGAKPRPAGRVREGERRPTRGGRGIGTQRSEAARRRAIALDDKRMVTPMQTVQRGQA